MLPNIIDRQLLKDATTGVGDAVELNGVRTFTAYIVGNGAVSAGAVQLEQAHRRDYTGTWAPLGAVTTVVANTVAAIPTTGTAKAVRARVTTPITGGTVTVLLVAN